MRLSPAIALVAIATATFLPFVVEAVKLIGLSIRVPSPPSPGSLASDPVYFTVTVIYKLYNYVLSFITNPYGIATLLSLTLIYYVLSGK